MVRTVPRTRRSSVPLLVTVNVMGTLSAEPTRNGPPWTVVNA